MSEIVVINNVRFKKKDANKVDVVVAAAEPEDETTETVETEDEATKVAEPEVKKVREPSTTKSRTSGSK